jgi:hypothetical protein
VVPPVSGEIKFEKKKREGKGVRGVAELQLGCYPGLAQKAALLFFLFYSFFSIFCFGLFDI